MHIGDQSVKFNWLSDPNFLVFGDSITYGHELKDAPHSKVMNGELVPSMRSWPALLGASNCSVPGSANDRIKRLSLSVTAKLNPKKVIIAWSYPERFEIPDPFRSRGVEEDYFTTLGHWIGGRKDRVDIKYWEGWTEDNPGYASKEFAKWAQTFYGHIYSEIYGIYKLFDHIHHAQLYLNSKNVEYFMTLPSYKSLMIDEKYVLSYSRDLVNLDQILTNVIDLGESIDWDKFIFLETNMSMYSGIMDLAEINNDIGEHRHPLERTHAEFANKVTDYVVGIR